MKNRALILLTFAAFVAAAPARAVTIQEITAPKSGVKAWLVEDHKLPLIALHFAFQGGSEQDPADKQGLATLATEALTQGAGPYGATAFQQQLADRSISLGFSAARDEITGGLKCLAEDRGRALDLLRMALTQPRIDTADINRLRAGQLAALRQQFADPSWQGRVALLGQIFGAHPYAQRRLGSEQSLKNITRDDVRNFAATHFARDTLTVAIAGDMTAKEAEAALDKAFADLPARAQLTPIADAPEPTETPSILVRRDGAQTNIVFALQGPKRADADWYAAEIANYILGGGGFSSRLMQEVRDKRGLTYGVSTALSPSQHAGLIFGHMAVDNPKTNEAMDALRDVMRHLRDDGALPREVAAAKDYLTGAQPLALTTTDKIAAILVSMQREKLGADYLDRFPALIRAVTNRDVARVLDRWFNPDKMTVVFVGKPEGIIPTQTRDTVKQ